MTTCYIPYFQKTLLFQAFGIFLKHYSYCQTSQSYFWKTTSVNISHFCPCESPDNLFYLTTQTCFDFPLILGPNGNNWLKIDPMLLDCILLTIHHHSTTCWPQALVLAALLVSKSGDRKARYSSLQCNLVPITTSLSLQQTAYSLACHFRDNTINQMWTSSSSSHISFPTSSTRTVILLFKPKVWQTSAGRFTVWVESAITILLFIRAKQTMNPCFNSILKVCVLIIIQQSCGK